ncbi:2-hydroxyacid dehydrogenase [Oscillatoria sp. HE19RPO]|uniref:2-hydroxyacid dehydrogenase n=1 Tax=Oscillatoria sp. HE19RPO TaxID=2954806 RepID=UPI0020C3767B|nr:hydroxyacid dehydrogenase [Oscillatoria sp. HE19RPO]
MKPKIVTTDANMYMLRHVAEELNEIGNAIVTEDDREETLLRHIQDADLLVVCYAKVTRNIIAAAKSLKGIIMWGVGVDNIDIEAATERNIPVANCPNYGTNTVADFTFALMLALARKVIDLDRQMRERDWLWPNFQYAGTDVFGKTIGLVGCGRTGKAVARRCRGFDMKILAYDPYVSERSPGVEGIEFVQLDELLTRSDFVSIHCPLTPETKNMLDRQSFSKMKSSAFLLNVARGEVVDEMALVEALETDAIAGAGLDVFSQEPLPANHPFFRTKNLILAPHFAYYTREADIRLDREALQAIRDLLQNRSPESLLNPEILTPSR